MVCISFLYWVVRLIATALLAEPIFSYQTIAHRGLFHDVSDSAIIAENSLAAIKRAVDNGLPGVEIDVRLSSDGVPLIIHDKVGNRATVLDNNNGTLNPVDVALELEPASEANRIKKHPLSYWNGADLKLYGRNSRLIVPGGSQRLATLEAMIVHLRSLSQPNFLVFLDIQDPPTLRAAAAVVQRLGMSSQVILKFYAKSAMDSAKYKFNNFQTCATVAEGEGLLGLQVVPQFNNNEFTIVEGRAFVDVFQTRLLVTEYLSCWFDAQKVFGATGAALVPVVSASVAKGDPPATQGSRDALLWASQQGRAIMSIVPNPDAGRWVDGHCSMFRFHVTHVSAKDFNEGARDAKATFAYEMLRPSDYLVIDVFGNETSHQTHTDLQFFKDNLC